MSIVAGSTPAESMACWPASTASVPAEPPKRRSRMPVRSMIHSSVVSSRDAKSALVTIFSGRAVPHPVMRIPTLSLSGAEPGDRLTCGDALAVDGDEPHHVTGEQRTDLDVA